MNKRTARRAALDILARVEKGAYSSLTIGAELQNDGFSAEDRAFATALVYSVLEHSPAADYAVSLCASRKPEAIEPSLLRLLRLGVCQILFFGGVDDYAAVNETVELAGGRGRRSFANAVLRAVCREKQNGNPFCPPSSAGDAYLEVKYSCPRSLVAKWRAEYGEDAAVSIFVSLSRRAPHAARVNTLKTTRPALLERLGGAASPVPGLDCAVAFEKLPGLTESDEWKRGLFHLQGISSQLCCEAVEAAPGQSLLDLCAAPGGKSFTLAEIMAGRGRVLACELHKSRLSLIAAGAQRLGLTNVETLQNDAAKENTALGLFDRVLCDVPCSGLGVLREKPEIRYRPLDAYARLPQVQLAILREGARRVAPGGLLVYSTCTLSRAENDGVAARFLEDNGDFGPAPLPPRFETAGHTVTIFPKEDGTDGFYIARFRKR